MGLIEWPALPTGEVPVWDGRRFLVDGVVVPFLSYSENFAGWDDDLTRLHKRESGGNHPIDVTSRSHAVAAIKSFHAGQISAILEVGSSDGLLLRDLKAQYPDALIVGAEVAPEALKQIAAEQPGIPLLQLDIVDCMLSAGTFDVIVALNVLEHIENDLQALRNMARLLAPGGTLVVEVPAGPGLYDAYDRQLRHFRRYRMAEIVDKVRAVKLNIAKKTHIGFFVYPMFALVKKLNRIRARELAGKDIVGQSIRASRDRFLLDKIFRLERALSARMSLPIGIRCVVVARKT